MNEEKRSEPRLYDWHRVLIRPVSGIWPDKIRPMGVQAAMQPDEPRTARLLDVSATGLRLLVHSTEEMPQEVLVEAALLKEAGLQHPHAKVVWIHGSDSGIGGYVGLELQDLTEDQRSSLRAVIQRRLLDVPAAGKQDYHIEKPANQGAL